MPSANDAAYVQDQQVAGAATARQATGYHVHVQALPAMSAKSYMAMRLPALASTAVLWQDN